MELKQKVELRRLLLPQLRQSLKILALPLLDLKNLVEEELQNNPFLEETESARPTSTSPRSSLSQEYSDYRLSLATQKVSLQDVLLRQLSMFANSDEEFLVGQEIIGNIDENGYLKATLEEIASSLNTAIDKVENALKIIQGFEPAGVGARNPAECLLIQLGLAGENDPLLRKVVECHLEDIAKKNYSHIAKVLKEPQDKIEPLIKKILKLDPKPGRNYSSETSQRIIPDVIIQDKGEDLEIDINDGLPPLKINRAYKDMLKDNHLDSQTKEFLKVRLSAALELLRSISKRKITLRKIMQAIVEIQREAIAENLSHLKPLTLQEVAQRLNMHESTICRAIMNKYVKLPQRIVALKDFFSSHVHDKNGQSFSSAYVKKLIKEIIEQEDKKQPLSDQEISSLLSKEKNLNVSRRTVAKYRQDLRLPFSSYRRQR
jgi:RNA polymerase sigma-54 factor